MPRTRAEPAPSPAAPIRPDLDALRADARRCRRCPLWEPATQTVFGEGPADAEVVLIGEVPGDKEDLAGRPFVGPAGKLLDRALADAGVERSRVYLTNAVKHFKFEQRGKLRLHKKPNAAEQRACRPWLEGEIDALQPRALVALGAVAAQALFGAQFKLTKERGTWREVAPGRFAFATVHPSSLLRAPDAESRRRAYEGFVADLRLLRKLPR
jgi:DNA polymerase